MWAFFGNAASLAGLIGVSVSDLIASTWKSWVALAVFILCAGFLTWRAYKALVAFSTQHYPRGYLPLSSFARITTSDGRRITYENFRHIQIKTPYRKSIDHTFLWTGSKDPVIASDLQTVSAVREIPGEKTREVTLTFPKSRMFNDVEVLHTKMEIDDSDGKSEPFLSMRVEHPVRLLNFRVELLHATKAQYGKAATISRVPIDKQNATPEELGTTPFDVLTKSYTYQIADPDPGWVYKVEWIKPNGQKRSSTNTP